MARKKKYQAQVESIHEEAEPHDTGWGGANWGTSGWDQGDQGGWNQNGRDQDQNINAWQNAPARDSDVQPGDSISNASYDDTIIDREAPAGPAPTPPAKDTPMLAGANGWDWAAAANEPTVKSAMKGQHRNTMLYGTPTALGTQGMLGAIAEQRQAQHSELTEQIRQAHQRAQNLPFEAQKGVRGKGKHGREASTSWGGGGWGQTSEVGTSHSNRPAGETNWGDTLGGAWVNEQTGKGGNDWAGAAEGTSTATKSKRKRSKGAEQQSNMQANTDNKDGGWGTTWGAGGGWDGMPASTSVAPGGFGAGGTWGAGSQANGWGTNKGIDQAPPLTQSQSWGAWTETNVQHEKGKTPKSGISGFFSRIFGGKGKKSKEDTKGKGKQKNKAKRKSVEIVWAEDIRREKEKGKGNRNEKSIKDGDQGKKGKVLKKQKFAEPEAMTWANPDDDEEDEDEDYAEEGDAAWGADWGGTGGGWNGAGKGWGDSAAAPKRTSRASDYWSNSPHGRTSKTYAMATDGPGWSASKAQKEAPVADHRIAESHGAGLIPARLALYSRERLARDRLFWAFNPNQDPRVASVLTWIQHVQVPLAMFGFSKFLESKERGALFTNVDYRSPSALHEPAFDWLTFDQIQASMDKILQESIACYDPASQIIVFVFLLSESKRSMAIWRRKFPLPESIRHTYGTHLPKLVGGLDKKYPILLDEMPTTTTASNLNRGESTKKKWLNWGR